MNETTQTKVAFVTGASSGIGKALALKLARQNFSLGLCARGLARLDEAASEISKSGNLVSKYVCDVTDAPKIADAIEATAQKYKRLDIVIANAGYCVYGDFEKLTNEDFERQMRVNLYGVLNTIRPALPHLKKTKGRVIIIGSVSGHIGLPGRSAYAMSKFALRGLMESLTVELAPFGISITLATPGYVDTQTRKVDRFGVYQEDFVDSVPKWLQVNPDRLACSVLRAAKWRRLEVVITGHALLLVVLQRLLPGLVTRIMALKKKLTK